MTDEDWRMFADPSFDMQHIYAKGVGTSIAPGHRFFINYMRREPENPSNYEANYLNALMKTHDYELYKAKNQYYEELLSTNGSLQAAWEFLQMSIDVAGPAN